MNPAHTIVVLSGGIDSTVVMALAKARGDEVTAVTIDYGQRHRREIDAAADVARHYFARHQVVNLAGLAAVLGGSALTDPTVDVPHGHYALPSMAATVVPNRNAILANVAVGVAVAVKADSIALGVHAGDHPVYPDCRPAFVDALAACVAAGNAGYHAPRVEAPFVHMTKAAVVALGIQLQAPLGRTWSCYEGGDVHCGRCGTCVERHEAFELAGVGDPTLYANVPERVGWYAMHDHGDGAGSHLHHTANRAGGATPNHGHDGVAVLASVDDARAASAQGPES